MNYFYLNTKDTIQRADSDNDGVPDYINGDGHEIQGLETELKADFTEIFSFFARYSKTVFSTGPIKYFFNAFFPD